MGDALETKLVVEERGKTHANARGDRLSGARLHHYKIKTKLSGTCERGEHQRCWSVHCPCRCHRSGV
jgi:hypothetical protein